MSHRDPKPGSEGTRGERMANTETPCALERESLFGVIRTSRSAASAQPVPELPRLAAAGIPCPTATEAVPLPKGPARPASHGPSDEVQASGRGPRGESSSSGAPPTRRSFADSRPSRREAARLEGTIDFFDNGKGSAASRPAAGSGAQDKERAT